MGKFILAILVFLFSIGAAIGVSFLPKENPFATKKKPVITVILCVGLVIALILGVSSFIVTLSPGEYGVAYQLDGTSSEVQVGYNFVAPWARMHKWDITMQVITFSQGEAIDDIYGAQTNEKDFIEVVATMAVHIDTERMNEYVALYGNEQISSQRIIRLLKTVSRNSIESTIGSYTTADVMGNKKRIGEESQAHLQKTIADLPIVMDSFTIDDLVAPESYEQAIKDQAQLRMDREKATLQQEINAQVALANKTKAEGEAAVLKTQAESDAAVKQINAENAATVAKIQADNEAKVKVVQAEAEANVRRIQAEAKANETTTQAEAEAQAIMKKGEAEAAAIKAQGDAYKNNEKLIEMKLAEIEAQVKGKWAEHWSGYSFEGMSGFNYADLTEILKGLVPSFKAE